MEDQNGSQHFNSGDLVEETITFTIKFVVSRCVLCKLRRDFWFFCSVNHLSRGGVNANHNATLSPSWARKYKTDMNLRMTLDCSRIIAKEIAMVGGIFVDGRRETLLYSCK